VATKLSPQLIKQSQVAPFIFQGRVRAVGENNLQGIPHAANHALVDVEQVLIAPSHFGELRGRVLTVVVTRPVRKGSRGVWWATSWVFDNEIGVIETGRADGVGIMSSAADVVNARLAALDELVIDRVTGADLIVAGAVVGVEELGQDAIAEGTTWRRAHVRVASVLKGNAGAEVAIQFPGAGSPRWATAPRLVLEQQGVFILRRPSRDPRMRKVKASGSWVALDPNDVHAPSSLARIEAFIRVTELRTRRTAKTR
jgi:hypothetical protein